MAARKILVTIDTDDDADFDEYREEIEEACRMVQSRAHVSTGGEITVEEVKV